MPIRSPGVLPDLYQSMPEIYKKPGDVPRPDYAAALSSRLKPIADAGQIQSVYESQARQKRDDSAYATRMAQLQAASNPNSWGIKQSATAPAKAGGSLPVAGKGWFNPVQGFTPNFGYGKTYKTGGTHHGIDLPTPIGTPIYAPSGGKIVLSGWDPYGGATGGFGNSVRMQNSDGTYTIIGHLSDIDKAILAGKGVTAGQLIGHSGTSGNSTGPHTHIEMRNSLYDSNSSFDFGYLFGW